MAPRLEIFSTHCSVVPLSLRPSPNSEFPQWPTSPHPFQNLEAPKFQKARKTTTKNPIDPLINPLCSLLIGLGFRGPHESPSAIHLEESLRQEFLRQSEMAEAPRELRAPRVKEYDVP